MQLNQERLEAISLKILEVLRANYQRGPESRDRAYEALNALADCVSVVILGCDGANGKAEEFFQKALKQNIEHNAGEFVSRSDPLG